MQTIGSIERGERGLSFETLDMIAGTLGVSVREFFPGEKVSNDDVTARVVGLMAPLSRVEKARVYRVLIAMLSRDKAGGV